MALVVETGAGLANAESYASADYAVQFMSNHGYTAWPTEEVEARLRRGTRYLELVYSQRWPGYRTHGRDQSLSWPRKDVLDNEGNLIPNNIVPIELQAATVEAGRLVGTDSVMPDTSQVERRVQVGPLSVEYFEGQPGGAEIVSVIDGWLAGLLLPPTSRSSVWLDRV